MPNAQGRARRALERLGGGLFLVAAAAHGGLAPQHVAEGLYGLGLLGAAGLEALWGLALVTRAVQTGSLRGRPAQAWRAQRWLLGLGIAVALAALLLHTGVPGLGLFDAAARVAEVAVVPVLVACWWAGPAGEPA